MALTKLQKEETLDKLEAQLKSAKIMVFARYDGLTVLESQKLRQEADNADCSIRVAKNRLVKIALTKVNGYKEADTTSLSGQLMYVFSKDDEVRPAQVLASFAKEHPALRLTGAIDSSGQLFGESEVKHLSSLPTKDALHGQLVSVVAAPLSGLVNVLSGNLNSLVNVLNAHIANQKG